MNDTLTHHLKTGGDPRTLADYASLRDELAKLTHPARPDVRWEYAEKLCQSLFEQNGVELQTAAWYTLARVRLAGLQGLNEGLAVLEALITHQWGNLWPQLVHARMDILSTLSHRLQQVLRTLTFRYADLGQLYQAEKHLSGLGEVLQRLELKHLSQLDTLRKQLHSNAVRLENSAGESGEGPVMAPTARPLSVGESEIAISAAAQSLQWVYVPQSEPQSELAAVKTVKPWKPFIAGMVTMLAVGAASLWGWQHWHQPELLAQKLDDSLTLPEPLSAAQIQAAKATSLQPEEGLRRIQEQLSRLGNLPPDWTLDYGNQLVQQAQALWPQQAAPLSQQWLNQLHSAALPPESLNGWHQGMAQLQQLTDRLNALDERRGSYMTGSELKTMVFTIARSFNSAVPAEEQLRQLVESAQDEPLNSAQQRQLEISLNALLCRYALLKQESHKENN
jgi:type VI secretion system protein VasL